MGADVMHRGRTDREAGFGMIEVLIAVALYAIALVSLFGLLITSVTAGTIGESSAVAVNLARQRIEGLTALDVPTLLAQGGGPSGLAPPRAGCGGPFRVAAPGAQPLWQAMVYIVRDAPSGEVRRYCDT